MNKISVIIPSYNSESTIERCIDSILNQTYDNFELIVVSDGSTDKSESIIDEYVKKDKRVTHIKKARGGVSSARNVGLDKITGDFIEFVDADDYLEPNMCERMITEAVEKNADLVTCHFDHPCLFNYLGDMTLDMSKQEDRFKLYQSTFAIVVPWNKLWRKSAVTDRFDEEVAFNEDDLFGMANMNNAGTVVSITDVLYHYCLPQPKVNEEATSCIASMASVDEFWKKKDGFFYMRNRLLPKVDKILAKHYPKEDWDVLKYSRTFDFMMWELIILHMSETPMYGMVCQAQQVMKEDDFLKSVEVREPYGVRMKNMSEDEMNENIIRLVTYYFESYDYIKATGRDESLFTVFLDMFNYLFMEENGKGINRIDIVADEFVNLRDNSTKEAAFVNKFMESKKHIGIMEIKKAISK